MSSLANLNAAIKLADSLLACAAGEPSDEYAISARFAFHELQAGLKILHAQGWSTGDAELNAESETWIGELMDKLRELF